MTTPRHRLALLLLTAAVAAALAGCGPIVRTRGNMVEDRRLAEIVPGTSTAEDVMAVLGTPSTTATFQNGVWYYIGQRTEQTAFFQPEVVDRRVIKITFDDAGVVRSVDRLTLADAQEVELVDRETPTLGRQMGLLEQFIGNIGRFNGAQPRAGTGGLMGEGL